MRQYILRPFRAGSGGRVGDGLAARAGLAPGFL